MVSVLNLIVGGLALLLFDGTDEVARRWLIAIADADRPQLRPVNFAGGDAVVIGYGFALSGGIGFFLRSGLRFVLRGTKHAEHGRAASGGHSTLAGGGTHEENQKTQNENEAHD